MWLMMGIIGLGWGSIMGNPYIILSNAIPAERTRVYMSIFQHDDLRADAGLRWNDDLHL